MQIHGGVSCIRVTSVTIRRVTTRSGCRDLGVWEACGAGSRVRGSSIHWNCSAKSEHCHDCAFNGVCTEIAPLGVDERGRSEIHGLFELFGLFGVLGLVHMI
jgi:hypothetical protein